MDFENKKEKNEIKNQKLARNLKENSLEVEVAGGALLEGCSGCAESVESVKEAPKRSWASVASMTVRIQSQVGFKRRSTNIWEN